MQLQESPRPSSTSGSRPHSSTTRPSYNASLIASKRLESLLVAAQHRTLVLTTFTCAEMQFSDPSRVLSLTGCCLKNLMHFTALLWWCDFMLPYSASLWDTLILQSIRAALICLLMSPSQNRKTQCMHKIFSSLMINHYYS